MKQVQNWASYEKRISGLNASMSLEELRAYCESNSAETQKDPAGLFNIIYKF
jgi:hypothetical protein